jgi:predicted AAA+ superfamily ATPase
MMKFDQAYDQNTLKYDQRRNFLCYKSLAAQAVANRAGLARTCCSAKTYRALEQTFLLEQIEPYTGHVRKNLIKSPKIFFFDSGFFGLVSGLTSYEVLVNSGKIGPIFENFCLNEIRKAMSLTAQFPEFHFWRTSGGAEVDFVIKTDSHLIPVEVKLSDSYGQSDLKNLLKFKAAYPKKVDKMVLIYNGPFQQRGDIVFVPIWFT